MITIALIGISAVLLAVQFKGIKIEYGIYISLAACVIIFFYTLSKLSIILETINKILNVTSIEPAYIFTLLKIMGITYIAEFSADICKDCGYHAVANQLQIFGKLTVLALSVPMIEALVNSVGEIL